MKVISRKDAMAQGLKFYFTGVPCVNGHLCEREVSEWRCLECRRAKATRKRRRTGHLFNAWRREKYATDAEYREQQKEESREWGRKNPDRVKARKEAHVRENREQTLAVKRANNAVRRANPEIRKREKELSEAWRKANPEKKRAHTRNRRARKRNAEGHHTDSDILAIWDSQGGLCTYCKSDLRITGHHVDHIEPLSKGGSNWPSNLQCLCPDCNLRKWNLSEEEFLAKQKGPHG